MESTCASIGLELGVNVCVDWLGAGAREKPASRDAKNLTLGFKVGDEPSALDESLVGSDVYMRWEKYGWQIGKITDIITKSTPRLFVHFNYRSTSP